MKFFYYLGAWIIDTELCHCVFLDFEESQSKIENLEKVTLEYQRAQEEAAEQARKAALLEAQLQDTALMHEEEKRRLVCTGKILYCFHCHACKTLVTRKHCSSGGAGPRSAIGRASDS